MKSLQQYFHIILFISYAVFTAFYNEIFFMEFISIHLEGGHSQGAHNRIILGSQVDGL